MLTLYGMMFAFTLGCMLGAYPFENTPEKNMGYALSAFICSAIWPVTWVLAFYLVWESRELV